jgi:hypothetical protein
MKICTCLMPLWSMGISLVLFQVSLGVPFVSFFKRDLRSGFLLRVLPATADAGFSLPSRLRQNSIDRILVLS